VDWAAGAPQKTAALAFFVLRQHAPPTIFGRGTRCDDDRFRKEKYMTVDYRKASKSLPLHSKIKIPYALKQYAEDLGYWAEEVAFNDYAIMRRDFPAGVLGPALNGEVRA
jgi:hypothetical protein